MAYKCLVKISNPISIAVYSKNSDRLAENNSSVGINCLLVPISFLISNSPQHSWDRHLPFCTSTLLRSVAPGHLFKFLAGQNLSLSLVHCLLHGLQLPQLLQPRLLSACRRKKQYLKNTYCCTLKGVKFGKSVGQYWFESLCHNWLTVRSLPLTRRNKDSTI